MKEKSFHVYILMNKDNSVMYTGVTSDLLLRMYRHRNHIYEGSFTDRYNVSNLVYYERFETPLSAIKREKEIKGWKRERKLKLIMQRNPYCENLYDEYVASIE
jgi:putative endonuclease